MARFLGDRRRLFFTAVIVTFFAVAFGGIGILVEQKLLGLQGETLVLWASFAITAGGVFGNAVGTPLFAASLEGLVIPKPPAPPPTHELDNLLASLRDEVLRRRDRQREQMLRGSTIMRQLVTPNLELRAGRAGKPVIRVGGDPAARADLTHAWDESGGRLVVLGKPGYGKTFAALTLIRKINRRGEQVADLFSLSEWYVWSLGRKDPSIEDWLVNELRNSYPEYAGAALPLVMQGRLVPVFDGLDEIPAAARIDCRNALEAYAGRESPHRPFILTCREEEYLSLSPKWVGADRQVALVGLSTDEIASVLQANTSLTDSWKAVIGAVESGDPDLTGLLRSPLHLGAVLEVYESRDPIELLGLAKRPHAAEELWDLLLGIEGHSFEDHDQKEVRGWLKFIAASIKSHQRQRFWLHELYLYAAPSDRHWFFRLGMVLMYSPLVAQAVILNSLLIWLITGVFGVALFLNYRSRRDEPLQIPVRHRTRPLNYLKAIPGSILFGLMFGLLWSAAVFPIVFVLDLVAQAIYGLPLDYSWAAHMAFTLLGASSVPMAAIGIAMRLDEEETLAVAEEPPQHLLGRGPGAVIRSALVHGVFAIIIGGSLLIAVYLFLYHRPHFLPWLALTAFLYAWINGFEAWAYYHWTRWRLARKGLLPLRLRPFLDWAAADTGILRASDSYEFRHRELLDYLAQGVYPVGEVNVSWQESRRARSTRERSRRVSVGAKAEPPTPTRKQEEEARHRDRLAVAESAVQLDPGDASALAALGNALFQGGDPLGALGYLREAATIDPGAAHLGDYARVLEALGRSEKALQVLSGAKQPAPDDASQLRSVRAAILKSHRAREVRIETAHDRVRVKPDDPFAYWTLATAYLLAGRGEAAAEARRRAAELAGTLDNRGICSLAWRLNARGYSKDAVFVAQALPARARLERAWILGQAWGDLEDFTAADRHLQDVERSAVKAEVLNRLAALLISRGRWADAIKAAEQAQSRQPQEVTYAFTRSEACIASGELGDARAALASALDWARVDEVQPAGDPAWLCRILWQYNAFPRVDLAIEMLIEEFQARGLEDALIAGLVTATPTSTDQTGWNPDRLPQWCFHWGRHRRFRAAVGAVQVLAAGAVDGVDARV